jgi:hypothetical protein
MTSRLKIIKRRGGPVMKAEVGDELVVEDIEPVPQRRVGTIVGLKTADGSPPYLVHWVVGDYDSLIYPGPGTRMEVRHRGRTGAQSRCRLVREPYPSGNTVAEHQPVPGAPG